MPLLTPQQLRLSACEHLAKSYNSKLFALGKNPQGAFWKCIFLSRASLGEALLPEGISWLGGEREGTALPGVCLC